MKKFFLIFGLLSFSVFAQNDDKNTQFIKDFYINYIDKNPQHRDFIDQKLSKKIERITRMIGASPIVDAQDFSSEMKETLSVSHLKNNWYKASFFTTFNHKKEKTEIFLKVENAKITSVYPWEINVDEMDKAFVPNKISTQNALAFVETFYQNYINCYISQPENIDDCLKTLENQYLSEKALKKIKEIKQERSEDNEEDFNPLISNFDFDKSFLQSLKVKYLKDNIFSIEYKSAFNQQIKFNIKIKKEKNTFFIDDILTK